MSDFLLELRCEEIPARMQAGARAELERLFRRELEEAGIVPGELATYSTPRRLALIARDLPDATEAVSEEAKGPPEGAPDAAIDGFCRKNGVTRDRLKLRDVKGRATWFAVLERPGRAMRDLLAEAVPAIVRDFAWPKSMRWGASSVSTQSPRWVRPLSGIVAILGEELVECEVAGIQSNFATMGHRFHHPGPITLGGAHDYVEKLRACQVIVDHEERALLIRESARGVAAQAGLELVEDEGLVVENAGLTEWPIPLLGFFDEAFLDVPPEVIQLTARVNQKYFVCTTRSSLPQSGGEGDRSPEASGGEASEQTPPLAADAAATSPSLRDREDHLTNAFICTANIEAADGGAAIVDGNRRVLAARLADARFFWEQDRRKTLAQHAEGLARITFHEKLGTVADKVERVAKLARWLVEEGIVPPRYGEGDHVKHGGGAGAGALNGNSTQDGGVPLHQPAAGPPPHAGEDRAHLADLAEQAARLCKADLVTPMVGEFPELQGVMGGHYACAEELPAEVADAIRDHYKPVGQGDAVPTAPVTVAVSLADKLDTLNGFFYFEQQPTGSRDPFALRRAALAIIRILHTNQLRLNLQPLIWLWYFYALGLPNPYNSALKVADQFRDNIINLADSITLGVFSEIMQTSRAADLPAKLEAVAPNLATKLKSANRELLTFLADRLKVQQREAGVRHDLIDAVFALGNEDDLVRLLARVNALQSFIETPDGQNLLAAYKRAANILKKEDWSSQQGIARTGEEDPLAMVDDAELKAVIDAKMQQQRENTLSYTPEPAEKALIDALDTAEPQARAAVAAEDFTGAMQALASLRVPIDAFFDTVTVNDPEGDKRTARLDLLARFRDAVGQVADFGRIEG